MSEQKCDDRIIHPPDSTHSTLDNSLLQVLNTTLTQGTVLNLQQSAAAQATEAVDRTARPHSGQPDHQQWAL